MIFHDRVANFISAILGEDVFATSRYLRGYPSFVSNKIRKGGNIIFHVSVHHSLRTGSDSYIVLFIFCIGREVFLYPLYFYFEKSGLFLVKPQITSRSK